MNKDNYLYTLACFLVEHNTRMSFRELREHLNRNSASIPGHPSFARGRGRGKDLGMAKHVTAQYNAIASTLGEKEASKIAIAFVKENGEYAWDR